MRHIYGILFVVLGAILAIYGVMHGYGQVLTLGDNLGDAEQSSVVTFGKLLIPLIAFYLAFRAFRAGVRRFKESPAKSSAA